MEVRKLAIRPRPWQILKMVMAVSFSSLAYRVTTAAEKKHKCIYEVIRWLLQAQQTVLGLKGFGIKQKGTKQAQRSSRAEI